MGAPCSFTLFVALEKNGFVWTDEQQQAFEKLKGEMIKAPVPALPDYK
jgi:hypothetical protein